MPTPAYMTITGEVQGHITEKANSEESVGNTWQDAHLGEFLVQEFDHVLSVPCDPQSGQPTGQRVHGAVIVTKQQDRSSPLLFTALTRGEKLPECQINFFRTSVKGQQEHYYSIKLTDALLVKIQTRMAHCKDSVTAERVVEEVLHFTYRAIDVGHEICTTSGADDWRAPIEG